MLAGASCSRKGLTTHDAVLRQAVPGRRVLRRRCVRRHGTLPQLPRHSGCCRGRPHDRNAGSGDETHGFITNASPRPASRSQPGQEPLPALTVSGYRPRQRAGQVLGAHERTVVLSGHPFGSFENRLRPQGEPVEVQ